MPVSLFDEERGGPTSPPASCGRGGWVWVAKLEALHTLPKAERDPAQIPPSFDQEWRRN